MKVSFIDQPAVYVSNERGEAIKQQLMIGAKVLDIDGNLYTTSSITAVTNQAAPSAWGMNSDAKRITAPKHERATEDSKGFVQFKQARERLKQHLSLND